MSAKLGIEIIADDGGLELTIGFEDGCFSAKGQAWFNLPQVLDFCDRLGRYPLDSSALPLLAGGYWSRDGQRIEQEHVRLAAMPLGNLGQIEFSIFLGVPSDKGSADALRSLAATRVAIYYSQAEELAEGLRGLVSAGRGELTFNLNAES